MVIESASELPNKKCEKFPEDMCDEVKACFQCHINNEAEDERKKREGEKIRDGIDEGCTVLYSEEEEKKETGGGCFPGKSMVYVRTKTSNHSTGGDHIVTRRIEDIGVGDQVLTATGFSELYAFMNHQNDIKANFLELRVASGQILTVTVDHIVFAHHDKIPVLAKTIATQDVLWILSFEPPAGIDGSPLLVPSRVTSIKHVQELGMHAPLTIEGTLIVDGILASGYAAVKTLHWNGRPIITGHAISMMVHAPLRWACSLSATVCGPQWHSPEFGRHAWTQWIITHFDWLRRLNDAYDDVYDAVFASPSWSSWIGAWIEFSVVLCLIVMSYPMSSSIAILAVVMSRGARSPMIRFPGGWSNIDSKLPFLLRSGSPSSRSGECLARLKALRCQNVKH